MTVQILGAGCPKCKMLEANAKEAIESMGIDAVTEKITDIDEIFNMGVMMTPAFAVDGDVKQSESFLLKKKLLKSSRRLKL